MHLERNHAAIATSPCSDLHRLAPRSPSPSPPRKPATVSASTHLAYARVPQAHPHIRRHRSTDFHTFRPPPIYRHVRRTFQLDLVQPPRLVTQDRRRAECASGIPACIQHGNYKTRRRRECPQCTSPFHHTCRRPHRTQASASARTRTRAAPAR
jgi:hypothetical protein